jgi:phage tail-like protein
MSANDRTPDPPWAGRFVFQIDGLDIGSFTELDGLSVSLDVEELHEGGQNQYTHKLPGRMRWPNLVFKRGLTNADNLFAWISACSGEGYNRVGNRLPALPGKISVLDSKGASVQTWLFTNAFPVKWSGPRLAATSSDIASEELEVSHSGFIVEPSG